MNAEEIRSDWVGKIVDRRFVLLEWLGGFGNSGVFLTELHGLQPQRAAIKLISADKSEIGQRIDESAAATTLSHPHLMKIFESGRSQIDGLELAYLVTEYAEEVLSQIIPERALTPEETREMLDPVIDTLSYLHAKGFVHGRLKPSNILVADNQLKLSTDSLLISGAVQNQPLRHGSSDAPLNSNATITPAVDVWSLGITVIEALTQHPPNWDRRSGEEPTIPKALPEPFREIARRCLRIDPALRCTLGEIKSLLGGNIKPYHEPDHYHLPGDSHKFSKRAPFKIPVLWMIVAFLALLAIIAVMNLRSRMQPLSPSEIQVQSPPSAPAAEAAKGFAEKGQVISRVLPDVPRRASQTIRGAVDVAIRVKVDASGEVSDTTIASHGPSKYFARLALESARSWKFKPAQSNYQAVPSVWILHYDFRRTGTEVTSVEENP
jgi:TonB family protein